jgi:hypothetical protein
VKILFWYFSKTNCKIRSKSKSINPFGRQTSYHFQHSSKHHVYHWVALCSFFEFWHELQVHGVLGMGSLSRGVYSCNRGQEDLLKSLRLPFNTVANTTCITYLHLLLYALHPWQLTRKNIQVEKKLEKIVK